MNRRIYYDGALINKIGIDRIVIKKVVLKEINAEKLDTALTCCAIHYDKVIVEGRQFYLTEKDNKFNYLKIDDNELGTLTFGVKNKQYGIYQFSPKEMWGGTNLVNYSAKEIHEFIEDAKIKLKDKYGLEVDFDDSEIREIELNTTFATKHKFSAYRRAITVMLFIMPYLKKDDVRSEKYRKTEEKLISSETVYNKQLSICVYNKTKEMELAIKRTGEMLVYDDNGVIVENDLMRIEAKIKTPDSVTKRFHGKKRLQDLDDTLITQVFEEIFKYYFEDPYERWKKKNKDNLRKIVRQEMKETRNWKIGVLDELRNLEQLTCIPVLLEMNDLYDIIDEFPDPSRHVGRRKRGFKLRKNDVFLECDHQKYIEILENVKFAIKNTKDTI